MKLNTQHVTKIDPLLQEALAHARGNETIRIIMSLASETLTIDTVLDPREFPSRQAYRQALIDQRRHQISGSLSEILSTLRDLSLQIVNSTISPVVVVEGIARNVLRSLELPEVKHASLDRLIGLPDLVTPEHIDYVANTYQQTLEKEVDSRTKEIISQAAEQYILKYYEEYGRLKILRMLKPLELEGVFTPVQLLDQIDFLRLEPQEIVEESFLCRQKPPLKVKGEKKTDGISVANQENYLMVLGKPGAGKSTFLRKIGLEALKGGKGLFQHNCLPILIEMKQFTHAVPDFEKEIQGELESCQFPFAGRFTQQALEQGKLLILLDGLDEVPTQNLEAILPRIENFVNSYPKNRFIFSIRTAAWRLSFLKFKYVEVANFDAWQIEKFVKNWFSSESDKKETNAEKCWSLLNEPEHKSTLELSKTPLLLTFICLVYEESKDLPKNRSSLYREALEILLRKWWTQKETQIEPIYQYLGVELETDLLSEIAYNSHLAGKLFFPRQQLIEQIQYALTNNENAPKKLDGQSVFNAIDIQQGILVERARDREDRGNDLYSFSHVTIQEYLVAQYAVNHGRIHDLTRAHWPDPQWKEVFLLSAGMLSGGVDELLLTIEAEGQKYLNTDQGKQHLVPILDWVTAVTTGSSTELSLIGKRCLAIAFVAANAYAFSYADAYSRAIRAAFDLAYRSSDELADYSARNLSYRFSLAYCYSLTCSYVSTELFEIYANTRLIYAYALAKAYFHTSSFGIRNPQSYINALSEFVSYARGLQKTEIFNSEINIPKLIGGLEYLKLAIPGQDKSSREHREFSEKIIKTWTNAFHLDSLLESLSRKTLEGIGNHYFYPNWLMVQCKQSAVKVSKQTWKSIESRMLAVPK